LPINTDTSSNYANYNVPAFPPVSSNKLQNSFFAATNFVGGFSGTGTTADKWTANWTNFDPVNTDYSAVCSANAVQVYSADKLYLRVSPNPAINEALVGYRIQEEGNVEIALFDMLGNKVKDIYSGHSNPGEFAYLFSTAEINAGIYFVNVKTQNAQQSIKLSVAK
jgi:hypothetical protein